MDNTELVFEKLAADDGILGNLGSMLTTDNLKKVIQSPLFAGLVGLGTAGAIGPKKHPLLALLGGGATGLGTYGAANPDKIKEMYESMFGGDKELPHFAPGQEALSHVTGETNPEALEAMQNAQPTSEELSLMQMLGVKDINLLRKFMNAASDEAAADTAAQAPAFEDNFLNVPPAAPAPSNPGLANILAAISRPETYQAIAQKLAPIAARAPEQELFVDPVSSYFSP